MAVLKKKPIKLIILSFVLYFAVIIPAYAEDVIEKRIAFDIEYGSATFTPFPLNDIGSKLYGKSISGTPFGGNFLLVLAPGVVIGFDYRTFNWGYDKGKYIDATTYVTKNRVDITQTSVYFDLSPFNLGSKTKNSIGNGIFVEIGPSMTDLKEQYIRSDTGAYSFTTTGYGLDIRFGYRTLTKEPLSFIARVKVSVPVNSDNKESESGLKLNGAVTASVNLGLCLSF